MTTSAIDAASQNYFGRSSWRTPLPNPPPQGGREPDHCAHLTMDHGIRLSVRSQLPHHVAAEAVDGLLAGHGDELDVAGLAGFEADRRAGGDVEAHAAGLLAVELQRRVGLEEMVVRA